MLGLLPISRAKLDWEMGKIKPPHVSLDPREFAMLRERSMGDLTPHQTVALELTLYTLQTIQRYIAQWEQRDDEMREILRHEPLLNQRQRSILARALRSPKAEFRIRYHQTNHNVAYTAARRDLLELQEKEIGPGLSTRPSSLRTATPRGKGGAHTPISQGGALAVGKPQVRARSAVLAGGASGHPESRAKTTLTPHSTVRHCEPCCVGPTSTSRKQCRGADTGSMPAPRPFFSYASAIAGSAMPSTSLA